MLIFPFLLPIYLARPVYAFPFDAHCTSLFGPLDAAEARAATGFFPCPALNPQDSEQISNSSISTEVSPTSHDIRYPILFHTGNVVIELYQARLEGSQIQLSRIEQAFYLWPLAKRVALHVIEACVDVSHGERGGWTRFSVVPRRDASRVFVLTVKRKGMHGVTFEMMRNWEYQIWPEAEA